MRISERDFDVFAEDYFPNMALLRTWPDCKAWSAGVDELLVVMVDTNTQRVVVFEYDTPAERDKDIQLILHLADDDGEPDVGVPAVSGPGPPSPTVRDAKKLPTTATGNR